MGRLAALRWINKPRPTPYTAPWWRIWRRIAEWWGWNVEGQG